jgi:hypothetical protein
MKTKLTAAALLAVAVAVSTASSFAQAPTPVLGSVTEIAILFTAPENRRGDVISTAEA